MRFRLMLSLATLLIGGTSTAYAARLPIPAETSAQTNSVSLDSAGASAMLDARIPPRTVLKLDATYNECLNLREALLTALDYNLPIRISKENWNYQRYQTWAALSGLIPTYSLQYSLNRTHVEPITNAHSLLFVSQMRYPVFQGGAVVYNILSQGYRSQAWKNAYKLTRRDKMLEVFNLYNSLCLQEALLGIERKSVQVCEQVLKDTLDMYSAGTNTQYGVMQARTQLFAAREQLAQQVQARRQAALALATSLNLPLTADLVPREQELRAAEIVKKGLGADECVEQALNNRAELRQYELFRLAAGRGVQAAAASLYPQFSFFTAFTRASVTVNPAQNGNLLNGEAAGQVASAQEGQGGVVSNTALNQTASVSPDNNNTGVEGANTFASVDAGGGGTPIANVQGGSLVTSGAVAPIFGASSLTGRPISSNINGANTASAGVFPGSSSNFQNGFNLSWTLSNMGLANIGNILSARSLTKQAMLQANQELQLVLSQVRTAYVRLLWAEKRMETTALTAQSAREALKFAIMRLRAGAGESLEVVYARRDYTSALSAQAKAIADYNQAQAQLLHDTGLISVESLTEGQK